MLDFFVILYDHSKKRNTEYRFIFSRASNPQDSIAKIAEHIIKKKKKIYTYRYRYTVHVTRDKGNCSFFYKENRGKKELLLLLLLITLLLLKLVIIVVCVYVDVLLCVFRIYISLHLFIISSFISTSSFSSFKENCVILIRRH